MTICQPERVDKLQHSLIRWAERKCVLLIHFPESLGCSSTQPQNCEQALTHSSQNIFFWVINEMARSVSMIHDLIIHTHHHGKTKILEFPHHPEINVRCFCVSLSEESVTEYQENYIAYNHISMPWTTTLFTHLRKKATLLYSRPPRH